MNKWLREPLAHFIVLGALIFLAYGYFNRGQRSYGEIVVTRGQQEHLVTGFSRTWQRPPTQEEFNSLIDDYIREEIAYREGRKMGLDENDTIIRRRLRQKLELLAEDVVSLVQPGDEQLQQYMNDHPEDFTVEPLYSLRQIYFSTDRRGEQTLAQAQAVLALLNDGDVEVDPGSLGDPLPLPASFSAVRESTLGVQFGTVFEEAVQKLNTGVWAGPVPSGFGLHLVFIENRTSARTMALEEARKLAQREWFNRQRIDTIEMLYERLREAYTIRVEPITDGEAQ